MYADAVAAPLRPRLVSVTIRASRAWDAVDPLQFIQAATEAPRLLIEDPETGLVLAGEGAAHTIAVDGSDRFWVVEVEARRIMVATHHESRDPGAPAGPRFLGGFSFFPDHVPQNVWRCFPSAWFALPRVLLTRRDGETWLTLTRDLDPDRDVDHAVRELTEEAEGLAPPDGATGADSHADPPRHPDGGAGTNVDAPEAPARRAKITIDAAASDDEVRWRNALETVIEQLVDGDAEKAVIARTAEASTGGALDPIRVLAHLGTRSPGCSRFLIEPEPENAFLGATPETLLSVVGRDARTAALASTMRAGAGEAEDRSLAARLLASPKERREHDLVVQALRRGLERFATDVTVADAPEAVRFGTVQHLRTTMQATLREDGLLMRALDALHPSPAVGGEPLASALRIIRAAETFPRGWYAGLVGWFSPDGDGTFLVAIRSAVSAHGKVVAYAGAGILSDSDPGREFQETALKFGPMVDALGR